ncbi:ABC transporter permease [Sphingosinicella sp. BN140058]|uniref:ABC transporter permease n=1 Tax=Sphingosinicella sp. BN140058 TaxID=1892855 RepID=UPI0010105809|nr:ABC transporter permease [Sphingosinicella sp. BN140058]QAY77316.1 ABC transporter permease [Sphingosinicella sp. BN140058]
MKSFARAAFVIGRRDFMATVWSRTFLLFLLGPLVIITISVLFTDTTEKMARQDIKPTVAVIASKAAFASVAQAKARLDPAFGERALPDLVRFDPDYVVSDQIQQLLGARDKKVVAVLTGIPDRPTLTGSLSRGGLQHKQITLILDEARQTQALAAAPIAPTRIRVVPVAQSAGSVATLRAITARATQLLLFMLTVLLAGMLLSNLLEEKGNKIIEVLAAAVPIDAIFVGKLVSMLAISCVGIAVWAVGGITASLLWGEGLGSLPEPAVGWPLYILLGLIYYAANYLLLGAVFLGIGSQANSVREVQTLSMPVTVAQLLIFLFASFSVGQPNSLLGIAAAAVPFSSPLTMVARAAQLEDLWPHLVAILWQALWVWLIVSLGAMLFRRNVLKSGEGGGARKGIRFGRRGSPDPTSAGA